MSGPGSVEDKPVLQEVPKPKIKHDWYQTDSHVIITILLKNSQKEKIKIKYGQTNLSFSAPLPSSESEYSLDLDLSHPIVPDQCAFVVTPSKIEIKLKKRDGLRWTELEGEPGATESLVKPIAQAIIDASGPQPNKCVAKKDWDKIEKEILKQEENETPQGDAAVKKLFEQIYGQGSDEVKKAMMKSYMESGGTVLSTNWAEVSKEKVTVKPPDGMEFKKWDG